MFTGLSNQLFISEFFNMESVLHFRFYITVHNKTSKIYSISVLC